mgnify:CR=1 FL=1
MTRLPASIEELAGLLRKTTGFHIHDTVLRYDGRTLTTGFVMERLQPILEAL